MAVSKERINYLVNQLTEKDLELVTELMERLANPTIPNDDEPTTQSDLDAIRTAHEALEKGELIDLKDIENELRG